MTTEPDNKDLFNPGQETNDLFGNDGDNTPTIDPDKNYLEELVGEGKKFSDPESLARGKYESDMFIERLKRENEEMRSELNARLTVEEALDRMRNTQDDNHPPSTRDNHNPDEQERNRNNEFTPEQLEAMLDSRLSQREQQRQAEQNLSMVKEKLTETFGPNYQIEISNRAKELGASTDFLTDMAKKSPKAFLKLVGAEEAQNTNRSELFDTPPRSSVDTGKMTHRFDASRRNKAYYDKIRKEDPKRYWSKAMQSEMHKEALKQGDTFFN